MPNGFTASTFIGYAKLCNAQLPFLALIDSAKRERFDYSTFSAKREFCRVSEEIQQASQLEIIFSSIN